MSGVLMKALTVRDKKLIKKMFSAYIGSKIEYCGGLWAPTKQT